MAKREKFIIAVAVLSVLVYLGTVLFSPGSGKGKARGMAAQSVGAGERLEQIKKSIADAEKTVADSDPGVLASYVVAHADVAYAEDPFYYRSEAMEKATVAPEGSGGETGPSIELIYTGYLDIGGRPMAIINGLEYELGDDVAATGFLLRSIKPDRVEIESREGKYFVRIPFVEEGF